MGELDGAHPPPDLWQRAMAVSTRESLPPRVPRRILSLAGVVAVCLAGLLIVATRNDDHSADTLPVMMPGAIGRSAPPRSWTVGALPASHGRVPPYMTYSLLDVAVSTPDDAWIVGNRPRRITGVAPLAWHWDGTAWRDVPVPRSSPRASLFAVTSISPIDAWAVGTTDDSAPGQSGNPLALHWDGARWKTVPDAAPAGGALLGVDHTGPNDVWAVGLMGGVRTTPLVQRWDGTHWKRVQLPRLPAGVVALQSLDAVSPNDVWITSGPWAEVSVVLHWDGRTLKRMPDPFGPNNPAQSITATSPNDVWAVGSARNSCLNAHAIPLAAHWNGRRWTYHEPQRFGTDTLLEQVVALAPDDVWALGRSFTKHVHPNRCREPKAGFGVTEGTTRMEFHHWDGKRWSAKPADARLGLASGSLSLAVSADGVGWIVGSDTYNTLVARLIDGTFTSVPHPRDRTPRFRG
jgi:hypothetical protein